MKNENGYITPIILALIFSLLFSSTAIVYFSEATHSNSEIKQVSFDIFPYSYTSNQNFLTSNYNSSAYSVVPIADSWLITSNGLEYVGNGNPLINSDTIDYFLLLNEVSDNNIYTNTYVINNTVQGSFLIILRYTGSTDQNALFIDSSGIHVPNYILPSLQHIPVQLGDKDFKEYSGLTSDTHPTIKTVYNDKENSVKLYWNGNLIYENTNLNTDGNILNLFPRAYAGIGTTSIGFIVEQLNSGNTILSGSSDSITLFWNFFTAMMKVIFWTIPELPIELNLILVKSQLIALVVCLLMALYRSD